MVNVFKSGFAVNYMTTLMRSQYRNLMRVSEST